MRDNVKRGILVFVCVAVVLTACVHPGATMDLPAAPGSPRMFFPMDMYSDDISSAFSQPDTTPAAAADTSIDHSFMSQAINMIPAGDEQTNTQMSAIKTMQQDYQPTFSTVKTSQSWMSPFVQPSAIDGSSNPAKSAYTALIKDEPNMKDIFAG